MSIQIKRDADGSIAFNTEEGSLQDVLAAICSLPAGTVATATIAKASVPKASGNGVYREPAKENPAREAPTARQVGDKIPKLSELPLIEGTKVQWDDVNKVIAMFGFTGNKRDMRTALKKKQREALQTA